MMATLTRAGIASIALVGAMASVTARQTPTPAPPRAPVAAPDRAPSGSGGISGIVVDHNQQPIRRASVRLAIASQFERTVVTDDRGAFSAAMLPPGRYTVTASKPGYPSMALGATGPKRTGSGVTLSEGQVVSDLRIAMPRGAALEGVVLDAQGKPMPGVRLMAWELRTSLSGAKELTYLRLGGEGVLSDDRGRYRVYGLPPGEYTVGTDWAYQAVAARIPTDDEIRAAFAATSGRGQQPFPAPSPASRATSAYAPVFYPNTVDPTSARSFTLGPGEELTGVDLQMQFVPMPSLDLTITDIDGTPAQVELQIARRSGVAALNSTMVTFVTGRYLSVSLSPGPYTLIAVAQATAEKPARAAVLPLDIAGGAPIELTLQLRPTSPVSGEVTFVGDAPKPSARPTISLVAAPGTQGNINSSRTTFDDAGGFTISGVVPGRYWVYSTPPASVASAWMLESTLVDGRDVTDKLFDLPADAAPKISVRYTDKVTEVAGRLVRPDGRSAVDYFVIALPASRDMWIERSRRITSTRPDLNGRYAFRGLPAGDYVIAVTTELDRQDLADASILERLLTVGTPVSISAGEKKVLDLQVAK